MSKFSKKGVRCDYCGKFSNDPHGEYTRQNGVAGYIWPDGHTDEERNTSTKDICDDCIENNPKATQEASA